MSLIQEYIKNKGSAMLTCIYSILIISVVLGFSLIDNMKIKSGQSTDEVVVRIFSENRLNQIFYDESYTLSSFSTVACGNVLALYNTKGKYFKIQDTKSGYNLVFNYTFDEDNNIVFGKKEVFCE